MMHLYEMLSKTMSTIKYYNKADVCRLWVSEQQLAVFREGKMAPS